MRYMDREDLAQEAYTIVSREQSDRGRSPCSDVCPRELKAVLVMASIIAERRILEHFERDPHKEKTRREIRDEIAAQNPGRGRGRPKSKKPAAAKRDGRKVDV